MFLENAWGVTGTLMRLSCGTWHPAQHWFGTVSLWGCGVHGLSAACAVGAVLAVDGVCGVSWQVEQQMRGNQGMGQQDDADIARLEHENTQLR